MTMSKVYIVPSDGSIFGFRYRSKALARGNAQLYMAFDRQREDNKS